MGVTRWTFREMGIFTLILNLHALMSTNFCKNISRSLFLLFLLLAGLPAHAQVLYDKVYGRAQRMSSVDPTAQSPRMNHLWMAYLVDSLQPSVLVDLARRDPSVATELLERAFRESGYDRTIGLQLMMVAGATQEWTIAERTKEELLRQKPDDKQALYLLMRLYQEAQETERAIDVVRELLDKDRSNSMYMYELSTMLMSSDRAEEAEQVLRAYLSEKPNELTASRLLVFLLTNQDRMDEAGAVISRLVDRYPTNPEVLTIQLFYLVKSDDYPAAGEVIRRYSRVEGATPQEVWGLMQSVDKNFPDGPEKQEFLMKLSKEFSEKYRDFVPFQQYALMQYVAASDSVQAKQEARRLVREGAKVRAAYEFLFQTYVQSDQTDSIAHVAKAGLQAFPDDPMFLFYDIVAFTEQNPDATTELLQKADYALGVISEEEPLYLQFVLVKADLFEKEGNWKEARKYYEQAIEGGNILAANNFAYFLTKYSEDPEDLALAEKLSAAVVKDYPDHASYLDTYAWVLYKRGAYPLAKVYMERALDKSEEISAEYYEHYAHILTALKEYDAAIEAWRKALESGADADLVSKEVEELQRLKNDLDK